MMESQKIIQKLENIETLLLKQGDDKPLTLEEAAKYLNLSKSQMYKLTSTGKIEFYRPEGKKIYFDRQELRKWLMRNRNATYRQIEKQSIKHVTMKGGLK